MKADLKTALEAALKNFEESTDSELESDAISAGFDLAEVVKQVLREDQ